MTDLKLTAGVAAHYGIDGFRERVEAALRKELGDGALTTESLQGFDDFHTGGRVATERIADLLAPEPGEVVLDAGSGLGGPARYLAETYGCRVIGVDLTPAYVEVARLLNERTGLSDRVTFHIGDVTALDLDDVSVDHVWTQHVAMNIADRDRLYAELRRVMRPGGRFVLFDVLDGGAGDLLLPVPWAVAPEQSHLVSEERQRQLLEAHGFTVDQWIDPTGGMVDALRQLLAAEENPTLGIGLLIDDARTKMANYFANMEQGRTRLLLAACTAT